MLVLARMEAAFSQTNPIGCREPQGHATVALLMVFSGYIIDTLKGVIACSSVFSLNLVSIGGIESSDFQKIFFLKQPLLITG